VKFHLCSYLSWWQILYITVWLACIMGLFTSFLY